MAERMRALSNGAVWPLRVTTPRGSGGTPAMGCSAGSDRSDCIGDPRDQAAAPPRPFRARGAPLRLGARDDMDHI